MMVLGVVLGVAYEYLMYLRLSALSKDICSTSVMDHFGMVLLEICFYGRMISFSLAPLADDLRFLRVVLFSDAVVMIIGLAIGLLCSPDLKDHDHGLSLTEFMPVVYGVIVLIFVFRVLAAMCGTEPHVVQDRMWSAIATYLYLQLPSKLVWTIYLSVNCRIVSSDWWGVLFEGATLLFVLKASWRQRTQAMLCKLVERHRSERAAAGIAALVGDCDVVQAHREAAKRFRSIRLSELTFEDLATNDPNPALFNLAAPANLHECDAFISHSWHDNAKAKWKALQEWRADFIEQHGREPTLWFDKCCIDQNNIDQDLRCLPIFLSGCRSLVVFAGPTYLSRLWCIMELFTFAHMHRGSDAIEITCVCIEGQTEADLGVIKNSFSAFDAAHCKCHLPEDKARLLRIICTAFGNLEEFNAAVRRIFDDVGKRQIVLQHDDELPSSAEPSSFTSSSEDSNEDLEAGTQNS